MRRELERLTFEQMEIRHRLGTITDSEMEEYAYLWRDQCYRYSVLGKTIAAAYAKRHGLEAPYSDRAPSARSAENSKWVTDDDKLRAYPKE